MFHRHFRLPECIGFTTLLWLSKSMSKKGAYTYVYVDVDVDVYVYVYVYVYVHTYRCV